MFPKFRTTFLATHRKTLFQKRNKSYFHRTSIIKWTVAWDLQTIFYFINQWPLGPRFPNFVRICPRFRRNNHKNRSTFLVRNMESTGKQFPNPRKITRQVKIRQIWPRFLGIGPNILKNVILDQTFLKTLNWTKHFEKRKIGPNISQTELTPR